MTFIEPVWKLVCGAGTLTRLLLIGNRNCALQTETALFADQAIRGNPVTPVKDSHVGTMHKHRQGPECDP